jgi:pyruvate-formate lyase-activating enzyme
MEYQAILQDAVFSHKFNPNIASARIYTPECNFNCNFCGVKTSPMQSPDLIPCITEAELRKELDYVTRKSKSIKINGGEPSVNPSRMRLFAEIAKEYGCEVILDTNGSLPQNVMPLVLDNLIDQVEVGLKGFSKEEAMYKSGTGDPDLAWNNPVKLVYMINDKKPQIRTLVNYVATSSTTKEDLLHGFRTFNDTLNNTYIRINNMLDPLPALVDLFNFLFLANEVLQNVEPKTKLIKNLFDYSNENYLFIDGETPPKEALKKIKALEQHIFETYFKCEDIEPMDSDELKDKVESVLVELPNWKNRIIFTPDWNSREKSNSVVRL